MSAAMQRQIDQLTARIRDLESLVARLQDTGAQPRLGIDAAIVSIESGNSSANPLGPLNSTTNEQTCYSGTASLMELVDVSGTLKLKPIQNSSGANRETLTYWNPHTDKQVERTSGASFLVVRLRDGRWYRVGGGGGGKLFLTTSTITARTGSSSPYTPGSGTGTMLEFYDDAGTWKVRTTSVSETLRHMSTSSISSGRIVQAKPTDGFWLVDVDYC